MLCDLYRYAMMVMCALVLMACVCRIDQMRHGRSRFAWFLVYTQAAMFALGVLIDLVRAYPIDWYNGAGVGGLLLYVVLTRHDWHIGTKQASRSVKGSTS
jgi:hypothetical protein